MTNEKLVALKKAIDALDDGETLIPFNIIRQNIIPLQKWLEEELGESPPECEHEWVDARNEVVKSGEVCKNCGEVRASAASPSYIVDFYDMIDGWIHYADIDKTYCFVDLDKAKRFCDEKNSELDPQNKKAGEHWGVIDLGRGIMIYRSP